MLSGAGHVGGGGGGGGGGKWGVGGGVEGYLVSHIGHHNQDDSWTVGSSPEGLAALL